jgi:hypothetical protein
MNRLNTDLLKGKMRYYTQRKCFMSKVIKNGCKTNIRKSKGEEEKFSIMNFWKDILQFSHGTRRYGLDPTNRFQKF